MRVCLGPIVVLWSLEAFGGRTAENTLTVVARWLTMGLAGATQGAPSEAICQGASAYAKAGDSRTSFVSLSRCPRC